MLAFDPKPTPTVTVTKSNPGPIPAPVNLLTDEPLISAPKQREPAPLMGGMGSSPGPTRAVKDSIMSLYGAQTGYNAYGQTVGESLL